MYGELRVKRTPTWYLVKSLVILTIIGVTFLYLNAKQQYFQQLRQNNRPVVQQQQQRQKTTIPSHAGSSYSNIIKSFLFSLSSSSSSIQKSETTTTPSLPNVSFSAVTEGSLEESGGDNDGGDEDGNSKICHKVARYRNSKCEFVKTNCKSPLAGGLINYLKMKYCGFEKVQFMFFIFAIFWVLLLFYMLSDTAETYFCPSLTQISRYLKLSPNVAGVTFLALGNGAPDIASIIAGVLSGSTGFGVGEPIGAGLFVTTCVMAAVTILSDVKVEGLPFLRDIGTYLASVIFVFAVCIFEGEIKLWHALACLVIYFIYVSVVVVGRAINVWLRSRALAKERKELQEQKRILTLGLGSNEETEDEGVSLLGAAALQRKFGKSSTKYYDQVIDEDDQEIATKWIKEPVIVHFVEQKQNEKRKKMKEMRSARKQKNLQQTEADISNDVEYDGGEGWYYSDVTHSGWGGLKVQKIHDRHKFSEALKRHNSTAYYFPKIGLIFEETGGSPASTGSTTPSVDESEDNFAELRKTKSFIIQDHFSVDLTTMDEADIHEQEEDGYVRQFLHWIEWDEKSWFDRIFYLVVSPAILARNLTIPQADPESWSKFFAVLCPLFIGPFVLFATGGLNIKLGPHQVFPLWALILMISVLISIAIALTSSRSRPPLRYHFLFVFTAFACSVIWIYLVANELVAVLQSIGVMWEISDGILALTVLAWGNSLGDMVSNVVVARQGYPEMAIGACYGGPCMNLLIGLGLSMTAHCLQYKTFPVVLEPNVFMSFVLLLGSIVAALLVMCLNKFHAPKIFGWFLLAMYVIFMGLSIMIETGVIFKHV